MVILGHGVEEGLVGEDLGGLRPRIWGVLGVFLAAVGGLQARGVSQASGNARVGAWLACSARSEGLQGCGS